ncbi:hypothetical protein FKW77_007460 [Venturia effusa]|uniref:Uncharacterized protein n=1 Tax=Venturia effusa TaxID=50376 RepID=A0A517L9K0_9PEZI|nr:hypothetical protein FKW77_007460 [Venturia effusa]
MERTDQDYADGLAIDLFSPSNRSFTVTQNLSPLAGNFVSGSTGETFVALSNYSYIVKTSDQAQDLIAKIELPYDPVKLAGIGIDPASTYVGKLNADKTSWVIDERTRNVHVYVHVSIQSLTRITNQPNSAENKTRIIKMQSLDGEYILLARRNVDYANVFVQYGFGETRTVNFTGGAGVQEAEFIDGVRLSVQTEQPLRVNADLKFGPAKDLLPPGMQNLYAYTWVVNTTHARDPTLAKADITFPINQVLLQKLTGGAEARILLAKRPLGVATAKTIKARDGGSFGMALRVMDSSGATEVRAASRDALDGEYAVLVEKVGDARARMK